MTSTPPVTRLVDDLFRRASAELVAGLVRVLGPAQLELAEDVVQEALARALRVWSFEGIPDRPRAWLFRVARNAAIDRLRHDQRLQACEASLQDWEEAPESPPPGELGDDTLQMVFLCCHPSVPAESHVPLTLKNVCGFGVAEIARALLLRESTVAQRLVRAKRRLKEEAPEFSLPAPEELSHRLGSVLQVIYLLFNEGYTAHQGSELIRSDCLRESLRLIEGLCAHEALGQPQVHALAALICFHAARSPARTTPDGGLLLLEEQDRRRWQPELLATGFRHLQQGSRGEDLTTYHLEAGIAACHAAAPDFESTDWEAVLRQYELLVQRHPSPVPRIALAVALARARGPAAGLEHLEALGEPPELRGYHLLHAVRAALELERGQPEAAAEHYRRALECRCSDPERRFLEKKLAALAT